MTWYGGMVFSQHHGKIKVEFYLFVTLEKMLTLHNVIMHIKSVLNKDLNHYYYNIS